LHQASDEGNVAAARRVDAPGGPHEPHMGNTGSRNRSTSGHWFACLTPWGYKFTIQSVLLGLDFERNEGMVFYLSQGAAVRWFCVLCCSFNIILQLRHLWLLIQPLLIQLNNPLMIIFEGYGVIIHGDPGGSKICCLLFMHAEVLICSIFCKCDNWASA
jgi:hypothetical protein